MFLSSVWTGSCKRRYDGSFALFTAVVIGQRIAIRSRNRPLSKIPQCSLFVLQDFAQPLLVSRTRNWNNVYAKFWRANKEYRDLLEIFDLVL